MICLWLCVLLQGDLKFSPNDAEATLQWMAATYKPVMEPKQNEVAERLASQKFHRTMATYKGKEVKWKMVVKQISNASERVTFETIMGDNSKLIVEPIRITKANEKLVATLKEGDGVYLTGKIFAINGSHGEKTCQFQVILRETTLSVPKKD